MPDDISNGPTRLQLEALWQSRVKEARERYYAAVEKSKAVVGERQQLPGSNVTRAVKQSMRLESAALREYSRSVKIFTALVMHAKVPPPE